MNKLHPKALNAEYVACLRFVKSLIPSGISQLFELLRVDLGLVNVKRLGQDIMKSRYSSRHVIKLPPTVVRKLLAKT